MTLLRFPASKLLCERVFCEKQKAMIGILHASVKKHRADPSPIVGSGVQERIKKRNTKCSSATPN